MIRKVDVANTYRATFAGLPSLGRESDFSQSARSRNHGRTAWIGHDQGLEGPKIVFDIQTESFPIVPEFVQLDEVKKILRGQLVFLVQLGTLLCLSPGCGHPYSSSCHKPSISHDQIYR
jgi:hypothetical protein